MAPSRVINVSSQAYSNVSELGATQASSAASSSAPSSSSISLKLNDLTCNKGTYSGMKQYAIAKLCNIFHASELQRRHGTAGVVAVSLHPGMVNSGICRHIPCFTTLCCCCLKCCCRNTSQGASTTVYCACADDVTNHGGAYFNDIKVRTLTTALANDAKKAFDLYELSLDFCADYLKEDKAASDREHKKGEEKQ